jgi:regulator of replication initiation timing
VQVVITSGHPHSAYRLVHTALEAGGLQVARPSRREGLTPEALTEVILQAHNKDPNVPELLGQMFPGKVWEDLAVDLFLGNLTQQNWGWADASSTWLLDFWRHFDAQTRFVLVYSSPTNTIANMRAQSDAGVDSLPIAVESWIRWNSELLRFSARHQERCLLVNSTAALRSPRELMGSANKSFGLHAIEPSGEVPSSIKPSTLESFLVARLLEDFPEASALYDELESAAHLADGSCVRSVPLRDVWEDYLASISNLNRLHADFGQIAARCTRAESDLHGAENAREDAGKQLEELRNRVAESQQAAADVDEQRSQLVLRNSELIEENQLLFLQLKQLQEALDQTSLAHLESERQRLALASRPTVNSAPAARARIKGCLAEVAVDMRQQIDGKNWYWAEHDGRWAGPGTHGTLMLPAMGPGRYEVNLDVVDAMDPEILADMQVTLCGIPLILERASKSYPVTLKGVAVVENAAMDRDWDLSFRFPSLSSPAQRGSSDSRQLAIRLRSLRLRAIESERLN